MLTLPTDSATRKNFPLWRGLWRYFPAALAGVAQHSKAGNDKHNPGEEMHHARGKSMDHEDCILRHLMDLGDMLVSRPGELQYPVQTILAEANALAWRALALSQELHERLDCLVPLAPGAKLAPPAPFSPIENGQKLRDIDKMLRSPVVHFDPVVYPVAHPYIVPSMEGYPVPRCAHCRQQVCACVTEA